MKARVERATKYKIELQKQIKFLIASLFVVTGVGVGDIASYIMTPGVNDLSVAIIKGVQKQKNSSSPSGKAPRSI